MTVKRLKLKDVISDLTRAEACEDESERVHILRALICRMSGTPTAPPKEVTSVCFLCNQPKADFLHPPCGHVLCYHCARVYLSEQCTQPVPSLQCPHPACTEMLGSPEGLCDLQLLPSSHVQVVHRRINEAFAKSQRDTIECTFCHVLNIKAEGVQYVVCPLCKKEYCVQCHREFHFGFQCTEYALYRRLSPVLRRLLAGARRHIEGTHDDTYVQQHSFIQFNSHLIDKCPAWRRFEKELVRRVGPTYNTIDFRPEQFGFYTWHGSTTAGVQGICHEGFDPRRRSRQQYGRGEYFGVVVRTSEGYVRGDGHYIIVTYVLRNPHTHRSSDNYCYVVDNPIDWSSSYCLPVAVITFANDPMLPTLENVDLRPSQF